MSANVQSPGVLGLGETRRASRGGGRSGRGCGQSYGMRTGMVGIPCPAEVKVFVAEIAVRFDCAMLRYSVIRTYPGTASPHR